MMPPVVSGPAAVLFNNLLTVFAVGQNGVILHAVWSAQTASWAMIPIHAFGLFGPMPPAADVPRVIVKSPTELYLCYRSLDHRLILLAATPNGWTWAPLTGVGGAPNAPAPASNPAVAVVAGYINVFYRAADGSVWGVSPLAPSQWLVVPVSRQSTTGAPPATGDLAIYQNGPQVHLFFRDAQQGHVWDLWTPGGVWTCLPLSGPMGAAAAANRLAVPSPAAAGNLSVALFYDGLNVFYRGTDNFIWRLAFIANQWVAVTANALPPAAGDPVAAVTLKGEHLSFYYPDQAGNIVVGDQHTYTLSQPVELTILAALVGAINLATGGVAGVLTGSGPTARGVGMFAASWVLKMADGRDALDAGIAASSPIDIRNLVPKETKTTFNALTVYGPSGVYKTRPIRQAPAVVAMSNQEICTFFRDEAGMVTHTYFHTMNNGTFTARLV